MWEENPLKKKLNKDMTVEHILRDLKNLGEHDSLQLLEDSNEEKPYIEGIQIIGVAKHNPHYPSDKECQCGHPYHRHFDSWENDAPVGCKYCDCYTFEEKI